MTFVCLDHTTAGLLCCPLCKGSFAEDPSGREYRCPDCAARFPVREYAVGESSERVVDLRVQRPGAGASVEQERWAELQEKYETSIAGQVVRDDPEQYEREIDSVREIYTEHFGLRGRILDVGGHQGRLRHFLDRDMTDHYVSIDPHWDAFRDIDRQVGALTAYSCLREPCPFVAGEAERLPFPNASFDWVHMRSCVDHFADPLLAFHEAHRVLDTDGRLMVGLAIVERVRREHSRKNRGVMRRIFKKLRHGRGYSFSLDSRRFGDEDDDHMYRLGYRELIELIETAGFTIEQEHWQKPPYSYCLYLAARRD